MFKSQFATAIVAFNRMYGLPVNDCPTNLGLQRLKDLKQILLKEVNEIDEIIEGSSIEECAGGWSDIQTLTAMADLMGDLQVYCASEMAKWGLSQDEVLDIIMQSNMSKLGADGLPIVNSQGKVEKGPNYWKPEPRIEALLTERLATYSR
jgi:hypothetical protein